MARDPRRKILMSSYGAELANTIGKDVRDMAQNPSISQLFPDFSLDPDSQAAHDWRTTMGGKYYACGVDGSTSGRPANLLIWDDLLKNREEADSPTRRNKAWSHYVSALVKRLEPEINNRPALEVGVMTRWSVDDPCGRIMDSPDYKEGDWHHIVFPAISKKPTQIKIARDMLDKSNPLYIPTDECQKLPSTSRDTFLEEDTALWPERFPIPYLLKQKRLDPFEFAALFQQEPFTKGGNIIKTSWWKTYNHKELPDLQAIILAADTAFKKTETSDYTVIMALGITPTGDIYILDVTREKLEYPELKRRVTMENAKWRGKGLRALYIEDKASGQSLIQDLRRECGMSIIPVKTLSDKVSRLNAVSPLIEGGRVYIPIDAPWLDDFLNETQAFPTAKHDDQVDALSIGLDAMSRMGIGGPDMINTPLEMTNSLFSQMSSGKFANLAGKFDPKKFKSWGE
jgi:predicted phage terminase large subunit-like protein